MRAVLKLEANSIATMAHMDELTKWIAEHDIDAIWLPLTQIIEFDRSRRMIWYDEYSHTEDSEPIMVPGSDQEIARERLTHSCSRSCPNTWPPLWMGAPDAF